MGYKKLIVKNLTEFMDYIAHTSVEPTSNSYATWYRGHSNYYYHLEPSAYRSPKFVATKPGSRAMEERSVRHAQTDLLHIDETTRLGLDLDWLCYIQHYGTPTRLLDWTLEISTALYFAFENLLNRTNQQGGLPCVWVFRPYIFIRELKECLKKSRICPFNISKKYQTKILDLLDRLPVKTHELSKSTLKMMDDFYLPILAPYVNDRIKMQSGCFIRFPILNHKPVSQYKEFRLDKFVENRSHFSDSLTQLIFIYPNEVVKALPMLNIEKKRFYPEVSSICESIKIKLFE
jgi:hypothetical protein